MDYKVIHPPGEAPRRVPVYFYDRKPSAWLRKWAKELIKRKKKELKK